MSSITLTREDDWYVITDEETGVTTQGESKLEALLMLADALAGYEEDDVDLLGVAIDVFVPDPAHRWLDEVGKEEDTPEEDDGLYVSIQDRFRGLTGEVDGDDDRAATAGERHMRFGGLAHEGTPWLRPPLPPDEIGAIEDDRLRALAWDLDAVARAYNYASDPTLPDLAREDPSPWVAPEERIRLERASMLLFDVYARLIDRVGDDLRRCFEESEDR